jgi:hypothetical protein
MVEKIQSNGQKQQNSEIAIHKEIQGILKKTDLQINALKRKIKKEVFLARAIEFGWLFIFFIGFVGFPAFIIISSTDPNIKSNLTPAQTVMFGSCFMIVGLLVTGTMFYAFWKNRKHLNLSGELLNEYQEVLLKPILEKFSPLFELDVYGELYESYYKDSELFPDNIDSYDSSELVTHSQQPEFLLGYIHSRKISGYRNEQPEFETVFDGMLACIPFPQAKKEKIFILPDDDEKKWGAVAKQLQGMTDHAGAKLVTMDNPDFEKAFQVYTTDSVQAHYLLSTKWLEKLTDFQRELKIPISIALHSGMCYVALHGYESPFTPQQDLEKALTASGVYTQYIRLKKLFDQLEVLQQIGSTLHDD